MLRRVALVRTAAGGGQVPYFNSYVVGLHRTGQSGKLRQCLPFMLTVVLGTLRTTMTWRASFIVVNFNGFMSLTSYFDVTYINIIETTYSCWF
jgi:hypothetical protein